MYAWMERIKLYYQASTIQQLPTGMLQNMIMES